MDARLFVKKFSVQKFYEEMPHVLKNAVDDFLTTSHVRVRYISKKNCSCLKA